jgi:antibiotic biosynthesis monooxygenase (ABM) superfamily enzyme
VLLRRIACMLRNWKVLIRVEEAEKLVAWAGEPERRSVLLSRVLSENQMNVLNNLEVVNDVTVPAEEVV